MVAKDLLLLALPRFCSHTTSLAAILFAHCLPCRDSVSTLPSLPRFCSHTAFLAAILFAHHLPCRDSDFSPHFYRHGKSKDLQWSTTCASPLPEKTLPSPCFRLLQPARSIAATLFACYLPPDHALPVCLLPRPTLLTSSCLLAYLPSRCLPAYLQSRCLPLRWFNRIKFFVLVAKILPQWATWDMQEPFSRKFQLFENVYKIEGLCPPNYQKTWIFEHSCL